MYELRKFTIALAIKGTEKEMEFIERSLRSAVDMHPEQIIIGLDGPANEDLVKKIREIVSGWNYWNAQIRLDFVVVPRDPGWDFQLANVIWNCYKASINDKILAYDVDSKLKKEVLLGFDQVGKDGVAVVSFTKRLRTKTLGEKVRYVSYRIRVRRTDYVFSGVYWLWKPYYFSDLSLEEFKKIKNGIDTFMTEQIMKKGEHKIITRKEEGVICYDKQNDDYDWRQFQMGVWAGANHVIKRQKRFAKRTADLQQKILEAKDSNIRKILLARMFMRKRALWTIEVYVTIRVLARSLMYAHPLTFTGYMWAKKHMDNEIVKVAQSMGDQEWSLEGTKYIKNFRKWKDVGTGFG